MTSSWDANGSPVPISTAERNSFFQIEPAAEPQKDEEANMATQTDEEIRNAVEARRKANAAEAAAIAASHQGVSEAWLQERGLEAINGWTGFMGALKYGFDFSGVRHAAHPDDLLVRQGFLSGLGIVVSPRLTAGGLRQNQEAIQQQFTTFLESWNANVAEALDGVDFKLFAYYVMVGKLPLTWYGDSAVFAIGPALAELAAIGTIEVAYDLYKAEKAAHAGTPNAGASGGDAGGGPVIDSQDGRK